MTRIFHILLFLTMEHLVQGMMLQQFNPDTRAAKMLQPHKFPRQHIRHSNTIHEIFALNKENPTNDYPEKRHNLSPQRTYRPSIFFQKLRPNHLQNKLQTNKRNGKDMLDYNHLADLIEERLPQSSDQKSRNSLATTPPRQLKDLLWDSKCNARVTFVARNEDAVIKCESFAPQGTVFRWEKQRLNPTSARLLYFRQRRSSSNDVQHSDDDNLVHFVSTQRIVCPQEEDQATYKLYAITPSGYQTSRTFHVILKENENSLVRAMGEMCSFKGVKSYFPEITHSAIRVQAPLHRRVVLPCRVSGEHIDVYWTKQGYGGEINQEVDNNGSLIIENVGESDQGVYQCEAFSYYSLFPSRFITTEIEIIDK